MRDLYKELMIEAAEMARKHPGVRLHTHLAENQEDIDYSLNVYGCRPGEYLKCALIDIASSHSPKQSCLQVIVSCYGTISYCYATRIRVIG